MEMERMNWKHQAEIDEMQFNHELSLKEFKASQEIKNQKVSFGFKKYWLKSLPFQGSKKECEKHQLTIQNNQ